MQRLLAEDPALVSASAAALHKAAKKAGVPRKEVDAYLAENRTLPRELAKQPKKAAPLIITGPPGSFQIDVMELNRVRVGGERRYLAAANAGTKYVLLIVEIDSRKCWAYPMKEKSAAAVLREYKKFLEDVGKDSVVFVEGDADFGAKEFLDFNQKAGIHVIHDVAADDHITATGDRLGIVDRLCRTLRKLVEDYAATTGDVRWVDYLQSRIVRSYNRRPHSSLDDQSPDEVFADYDKRMDAWMAENEENERRMRGRAGFQPGDTVRIVTKADAFGKATYRMSAELYRVVRADGPKWRVKPAAGGDELRRRFKPDEMVKTDAGAPTAAAGNGDGARERATARAERGATREGIAVDRAAIGKGGTVSSRETRGRPRNSRKKTAARKAPPAGTDTALDGFESS